MRRELFGGPAARRAGVVVAVVLALGLVAGCGLVSMFTSTDAKNAEDRVRQLLEAMQPGGDLEKATALWHSGSIYVSGTMDMLNTAADGFDAWREARGLEEVSSFEILEVEVTDETRLGKTAVVVSVVIDGEASRMRVVQGYPIEWIN